MMYQERAQTKQRPGGNLLGSFDFLDSENHHCKVGFHSLMGLFVPVINKTKAAWCSGTTKKGESCQRRCKGSNQYCSAHDKESASKDMREMVP
ncbi:hypothetical protein CONCODRAFT_3941 [Conidiobolus coronatus NRRL 28638]|uniref:Uncharacterized protein n=1 Tax=Conidiobolus coronatus (strain ATCC 28846 / CBS 209.66 / NRRL 28638) TaxID=796925 RepID=A0A137PE53_CONC2|nr:hypothetical protein CONCODRAFT_3941 [Conidiobolus coronatus NRRL 28638]|eukprot:KXN73260.1 hypothetical protein CONCODRAFT_3941 [Conidiobolus coronatus NRRL 28638]